MFLLPMNSKTIALLAIVCGLVVLCLGMWYIWNTQQLFRSEMQYVRDQCDQLQKQILLPNTTQAKENLTPKEDINEDSVHRLNNENVRQDESSTCSIVHRSCSRVTQDLTSAPEADPEADNEEDSELSEEDTTDDENYDDDDQLVQKEDLVEAVEANEHHNHSSVAEASINTTENAEQKEEEEDTNQLVQSLLSTIVSSETNGCTTDTVDDTTLTNAPPLVEGLQDDGESESHALHDATDESVEDFMESKSDYNALADTLRKKTVVELKKMCQEYQIGVKNGKSFKRKEELIGELVEKLPQ